MATGTLEGFVSAPAVFTCPAPSNLLYCQSASPGTDFLASQDFEPTLNAYDSLGADDFVISSAGLVKSWQINSVSVGGSHYPANANKTTTSVTVRFYADNGARQPAQLLFQQTVTGGILDPSSSGEYSLALSPPARLAAGGRYWVSVQAVKPSGNPPPQWVWLESELALDNNMPATWQNPGNAIAGTGCTSWTAANACFPGWGPNLLFSVSGISSTITNTTPVLVQLTPPGAYGGAVPLSLIGANFAPGAVISWTVNSTTTPFTVTSGFGFVSSTALTATIPAEQVSPQGAKAQVVVVNPSPCYSLCTSNALTFTIDSLQFDFMPFVRR